MSTPNCKIIANVHTRANINEVGYKKAGIIDIGFILGEVPRRGVELFRPRN
jgi:hypothetical protein